MDQVTGRGSPQPFNSHVFEFAANFILVDYVGEVTPDGENSEHSPIILMNNEDGVGPPYNLFISYRDTLTKRWKQRGGIIKWWS